MNFLSFDSKPGNFSMILCCPQKNFIINLSRFYPEFYIKFLYIQNFNISHKITSSNFPIKILIKNLLCFSFPHETSPSIST